MITGVARVVEIGNPIISCSEVVGLAATRKLTQRNPSNRGPALSFQCPGFSNHISGATVSIDEGKGASSDKGLLRNTYRSRTHLLRTSRLDRK